MNNTTRQFPKFATPKVKVSLYWHIPAYDCAHLLRKRITTILVPKCCLKSTRLSNTTQVKNKTTVKTYQANTHSEIDVYFVHEYPFVHIESSPVPIFNTPNSIKGFCSHTNLLFVHTCLLALKNYIFCSYAEET